MSICVADLASHTALKTRILAGHQGSDRRVTWAHVCELARPWEWLDPGVLLLTNGLALPVDGAAQADFVESLARAELAGMVLSQYAHAPSPTKEMLRRADELAFPVLYCEGSVSLSEIIKAVAAAAQSQEYSRLVKTLRLYDCIRFAIGRGDTLDLALHAISRELDCGLALVDGNGEFIERGQLGVPGIEALLPEALSTPDPERPGLIRFEHADRSFLALDLGTTRSTYLIAATPTGELPPLSLLRHAATGIALEVERRDAERERGRRRSIEIWKNFLDGRADRYGVIEALTAQNLRPAGGVRVLAVGSEGDEAPRLMAALTRAGVPYLPADRPPIVSVLVPADTDISAVTDEVRHYCCIGVSEPHTDVSRLVDAAREARWALVSAQGRPGTFRYGHQTSPLMPRSVEEARRVVQEVLGPVIEYDSGHRSELLKSLRTFVALDRSWQKAADQLFVHKQTLVYRMRRVEELTRRKISSSSGLAELWLALQAYDGLENQ
jgi:purine catabolism regulator